MKKLALTAIVLLLTGCAANELTQGAQMVRIMDTEPENCTFIGEVDGTQGNWWTATYTSDRNIMVGARNEAKNHAYAMGANVLVLKKSVDGSNAGIEGYADSSSSALTTTKGTYNSVIIAEAFNCK